MKTVLIFATLVFAVVHAGSTLKRAPTYVIDLDKPADQRWLQVVTDYKAMFPAVVSYFESKIPSYLVPIVEEIASLVEPLFGEYGTEMKSIAQASGIDVGIVVTLNMLCKKKKIYF